VVFQEDRGQKAEFIMRDQTSMLLLRSRWIAIGAAVAVTLGFGSVRLANATVSAGERNVFVPIVPCRIADTRPAPSTVGARSFPLVKDDEFPIQVRGTNGNCTISNGATSVVLNVTALDAKSNGFLTVWPAENLRPNTSNLNFSGGQAPVPNAVTVKLDSRGGIKIYNSSDSVNVIVDVVGYYEDHNHDDAYAKK
jgi:hypothetical protein